MLIRVCWPPLPKGNEFPPEQVEEGGARRLRKAETPRERKLKGRG